MTRERVDIAVIGTVGGVGATTLTVALAAVAARRGETVELASSPASKSYCANGLPAGLSWGGGAPMGGCTVAVNETWPEASEAVRVVVVDASIHGLREARWAMWGPATIVVRTRPGSLSIETVAETLGYDLDELIELAEYAQVRRFGDAGLTATHTPASLVKVAETVLDWVLVAEVQS